MAALILLSTQTTWAATPTTAAIDKSTPEPLQRFEGLSGDLAGMYSWGSYSSAGQAEDSHSGMGLQFFGGYRLASNLEGGLFGSFSFPQIAVPEANTNVDFSQRSVGLAVGYLWREKVEPFVMYSPFAELSQSTTSRQGLGTVTTDLTYQGHSLGLGAKVYLTPRNTRTAQVGLKFAFIHESYTQAKMDSRIEAATDGHPAPAYTPVSASQPGLQSLSGDTYSMGVFIGI